MAACTERRRAPHARTCLPACLQVQASSTCTRRRTALTWASTLRPTGTARCSLRPRCCSASSRCARLPGCWWGGGGAPLAAAAPQAGTPLAAGGTGNQRSRARTGNGTARPLHASPGPALEPCAKAAVDGAGSVRARVCAAVVAGAGGRRGAPVCVAAAGAQPRRQPGRGRRPVGHPAGRGGALVSERGRSPPSS